MPDGTGSYREEWVRFEAKFNKPHPDAAPPSQDEFFEAAHRAKAGPDAFSWLSVQLDIFLELSRQRSKHANGVNPISFLDVEAYLRLNRVELHPIELNTIMQLDFIYLNWVNEMLSEQMARANKGH